ncbi:type VI secretion system tube protein Hcp [Roseomonas sp. JC162]|uniref:Type VI secretion system tube protein Hcp n=1 Tax=Neoroseomonas marina TaxID=1232220 RepID=A0A848E9H4_9PROT|nr:type VI secretion system tube protein Hcp [Neoroseomonas marina]NMJ39948.1 type VI secretion system tube protein Hcp [Neoroseomonas marina]
MAIFMCFEGVKAGPLKGEAKVPGDVPKDPASGEWIELSSCSFSGQPHSRLGAKVDTSINVIRITKATDGSSVGLLNELFWGGPKCKATIVFMRTDSDAPVEYMRLELKDVGVVACRWESGTDRPAESYDLTVDDFTVVTWTFEGQVRGAQSVTQIMNRV